VPLVLRRTHPSPLGVVFAVSLTVLLAASGLVMAGASELLGLGRDEAAVAVPFVGFPF
jgi:hypothetical protein